MRPQARLIVAVAAVVITALVVLIVATTVGSRSTVTSITDITYSQSKSVKGFSGSSHETSDASRIAAFTAIASKYRIDVTRFDETLNDVCTGGLITDITLGFADAKTATLRVYDCGRTVARGTFVSDTSALFTRWRAQDDG
ncbi:hypothetical protein [Frigoribacterium sp. CG_9.8]|uniref:hypothetical protein n=1 Tax=Frigoribacterium sp. CG_9.8 TaxID=2787733 RepID=UPI0018CB0206|nr:hypothetical protein [Frigoribacterium sp. CG_9.8]MBG6106686.1 hypothetical protein [Frigoribacterium sp. CG_9.8]